jgi:uncharacterized lipoprotein NlpE involved in copper resistance
MPASPERSDGASLYGGQAPGGTAVMKDRRSASEAETRSFGSGCKWAGEASQEVKIMRASRLS